MKDPTRQAKSDPDRCISAGRGRFSVPASTIIELAFDSKDDGLWYNGIVEYAMYKGEASLFKILIAEDDLELRLLFERVLGKNGYATVSAADGDEALRILEREYVDLIISDVMMPGLDGFALTHRLRDMGVTTPILMITARGSFEDMRTGFDSGTDDYMVKPINVNEMVLRVGSLLRRAQILSERRQKIGETVMECDSLTVTRGDRSAVLPQKEFMLLYKMASYPGKIFTRQQLMNEIWGYDAVTDSHTVDVHIGRLRERFKDNPDFKIVTLRGVGYKVVRQ